jgi:DNA-binding MarR family transcriptional regulator
MGLRPEDCIFFQLAKASQSATRFWAGKIAGLNLTAVQGILINFLLEDDQITSRDLGKKTMLDSATLTGILDRLELAGIIERRQHPEDRRAIHILLTDKGRQAARSLREIAVEANKEYLRGMTLEEQSTLKHLLSGLRIQT